MLADHIRTQFAYNDWAWKNVFASLEQLDEEAYHQKRPLFTDISLHELLVHGMTAEYIWLSRCLGHSPDALFNPKDFDDLTAVRVRWAVIEDDWSNFLRGLTDEALARQISYRNTSGTTFALPLADILQHVINHATEHRSQMTPTLYQLGAGTPPLDFMRFRLKNQ